MRFAQGTARQKALFGLLVAVFACGFVLDVADKLARVGRPDVGWIADGGYLSPSRHDASDAGLRGGGRLLALNGVDLTQANLRGDRVPGVRDRVGDVNTIRILPPHGPPRELTIEVRPWTWRDAIFTEGGTGLIGVLFFLVGVTTFVLRPWEASSWALLSFATFVAGSLLAMFIPITGADASIAASVYFRVVVAIVCWVPLHLGLAFPVVSSLLSRRPGVLVAIYGLAGAEALVNLAAWRWDQLGPLRYSRSLGAIVLLATTGVFVGRCLHLALPGRDPLVAQRARILLAGSLTGIVPVIAVQFVQQVLGVFVIDTRFSFWALGLSLLSLARVTLRQELLNARIAVRRAVAYGSVVGVLTLLAIVLISFRPYAVAALLLPLLYLWPRFDDWLDARLYPQRAHLPELLRSTGTEMARQTSAADVLGSLARAPMALCDAQSGVAFLLARGPGAADQVRSAGLDPADLPAALADEAIVRLMVTTRKEMLRSRVAVDPLYSNIKPECYAGFARLHAEVLIPIESDQQVVGGLAVGARASGDVYQSAELQALSAVALQGAQALARVEATDRLRARELEFADLKRFFPPQIIDQVMARGGASELRSQRKVVTVVFADLRGFTSFSETAEPEEVMSTLAEYHAAMGRRIAEFGGTLERFAGDGFMVFFNDPLDQPDHAERAIRMALAMRDDVRQLRDGWERKGFAIDVGVGIATGYATCGFVGYEGRRDYGVIGNVTNLAARLSGHAAPQEILVAARVLAEIDGRVRAESLGELTLKGFSQPQPAFRVIAAA